MLDFGKLQLEFGTMLVQLVIFLVLLALLGKFALKPLMKVLNDRQSHIENQILDAQTANKDAARLVEEQKQALDTAKKEAHDIIEQARLTSVKQADEIIQGARTEADRLKEQALSEIENEKKKAITALRSQVSAMSVMIASKIIEKQVDEKSQQELVEQYLSKVGNHS